MTILPGASIPVLVAAPVRDVMLDVKNLSVHYQTPRGDVIAAETIAALDEIRKAGITQVQVETLYRPTGM